MCHFTECWKILSVMMTKSCLCCIYSMVCAFLFLNYVRSIHECSHSGEAAQNEPAGWSRYFDAVRHSHMALALSQVGQTFFNRHALIQVSHRSACVALHEVEQAFWFSSVLRPPPKPLPSLLCWTIYGAKTWLFGRGCNVMSIPCSVVFIVFLVLSCDLFLSLFI